MDPTSGLVSDEFYHENGNHCIHGMKITDSPLYINISRLFHEYIREMNEEPRPGVLYKGENLGDLVFAYRIDWMRKINLVEINENKDPIFLPFEILASRWSELFLSLSEFHQYYDRLPSINEEYDGVRLGFWLYFQRILYMRGINAKAKYLLGTISPTWYSFLTVYKWEDYFNLLRAFVNERNRTPEGNEKYKGVDLGEWMDRQLISYQRGEIEIEKVNQLAGIDIVRNLFRISPPGVDLPYWFEIFHIRTKANKTTEKERELYDRCNTIIKDKATTISKDIIIFELIKEYVNEFKEMPGDNSIYMGCNLGKYIRERKAEDLSFNERLSAL